MGPGELYHFILAYIVADPPAFVACDHLKVNSGD